MRQNKIIIRRISEILILIIATAAIIPQARELINNQEALSKAYSPWVALAALVYSLTMFLAAASFIYLSNRPLGLIKTLAVQVANGFTNRILPSGSGAITTNSVYLKKSGHELPEALTLSLINNILGFLAFLVVMFLLGAFQKDLILNLLPEISSKYIFVGVILLFFLFFIALRNKIIKSNLHKVYEDFSGALSEIAERPLSAFMALLANCGITIIHVVCLALCIISTGYSLPTGMVALVFASAITAVSLSPTPNGLGVTEIAMSLALQSFGVGVAESLVIIISYRIVTFWLPIIPGYVTYRILRYKNII